MKCARIVLIVSLRVNQVIDTPVYTFGLGIERFNGSGKFSPRNNAIHIIKKQLFACLFTELLKVVISKTLLAYDGFRWALQENAIIA